MTRSHLDPIRFGRYTLVEKLAVGGMAEIFKAKAYGAHGFEKTVVIKRILPQLVEDPEGEFVQRFITEARLMMRLTHPKVVQVLDFGDVDGHHYIAMEYVAGIDGAALLRLCARARVRPTTGIAVHIVAEVLDALDYAHNLSDETGLHLGIAHRDISPSNIFISDQGQVKLGDFGIARVQAWQEHTDPAALKGKYGYMAPEAIADGHVDHRADLFSTGVVLAELLTIRRLFTAGNPLDVLLQVRDANLERLDEHGAHIDPPLRKILDAALARDPRLRFQDAAAFRDSLHRYLFERRLMVRDAEVRVFLRRLREAQPVAAEAEARPVRAPAPAAISNAGVTVDARPPRPPGDAEIGEGVYSFGGKGRRRRITLRPPPRPAPVPTGVRETGEAPRLPTRDALAAVVEVEEASASADFQPRGGAVTLPVTPSLAELASPPPAARVAASQVTTPAADPRHAAPPDLRGDLVHESAARIFFRLALEEERGLLVLRQADIVKEVYFDDGDPEYVASNQPQELFGQYLLRTGVITEGELTMALAMLPHFDGKLGAVLVSLKRLRPMEVLKHLTHQVRRKLLDVFTWEKGSYAFYRDKVFEQEAAPLGLDGFEIVSAGVWAMPIDLVLRRLDPLKPRPIVAVSPPPVPLEVFRLGAQTRETYGRLDGRPPLGQWLARFTDPTEQNEFARTIYLLLETGLALPVE